MAYVNVFIALSELTKASSIEWEDIEGSFRCTERECYAVTGDAKYSSEEELITWVCSNGHENVVAQKL